MQNALYTEIWRLQSVGQQRHRPRSSSWGRFMPLRMSALQASRTDRRTAAAGIGGPLRKRRRQNDVRVHAVASEPASEPKNPPTPSQLQLAALQIDFDNDSDPDATVIQVSGQNKADLLMALTGAFNSLDLRVVSANITSNEEGLVLDVFRVTDSDDQKIPEADWDAIQSALLAVCAGTSRSSKPAIYGLAAEAELRRLRPLSTMTSNMEDDAAALELAAAEMAQAAANLVSLEREIMSTELDKAAANVKETARSEAAALLERRMAAMEAVLASRRSTMLDKPAEPSMQRGPGADLRFSGGGATSTGPAAGDGNEIILQGFNWESHKQDWYKLLAQQAKKFREAGISAIWMPPPSASVSPQGYLPTDLYNLNSQYGSEGELRACIAALHAADMKVIADIVINHRCAAVQDEDGRWNKFGGRLAWDKSAICCNNPAFGGTGNGKTGEDYVAAPNVDHTQERVRKDLVAWLNFLRVNVGFDGWRFDFVKGYAGKFTREYIDATVPAMAFGEFWDTCDYTDGVLNYNQDAHRQRTVSWCDQTGGTAAAFDFTLKGILQEAMGRGEYWRLVDSQGRPPGVLGMWPSRAVTFVDNHDTGSTLNHWPFPGKHLAEAYAYLLTHPGTPCVFYDHYMDGHLGEVIQKLINIRRRIGLNARSKVVVQRATADVYAACIDSKLCIKVGYGSWSPGQHGVDVGQRDWVLETSGPNYACWSALM